MTEGRCLLIYTKNPVRILKLCVFYLKKLTNDTQKLLLSCMETFTGTITEPFTETLRRQAMITIRDIARLSGYSIGTVSRVINDRADVSDEAREKIERIIREYVNGESVAPPRK